ncbi:MAG: cobalamin B12-binding domain-containing protein [Candidatus Zixiibacteriota bacterium]
MSDKIRVLLAKVGLDGHDRGIKVIAAAMRDAGFEVIYTGLRQTPEMIAEAALQEDVDAIGVSILSGAHMTLFPLIYKAMQARNCTDILLFGGGIMTEEEMATLRGQGVDQLFGPGTPTPDIITYVKDAVGRNRKPEKIN